MGDLSLHGVAPATLALRGELGFATVADALASIRQALADPAIRQLDLAGLERSDSAGLACLLVLLAEASRAGRTLHLLHVPDSLRALARVCDVEPLLA